MDAASFNTKTALSDAANLALGTALGLLVIAAGVFLIFVVAA